MKKLFLFVFLGFISINAQFITPGTGVQWTLDSLVANSAGAVTGTFPNYTVAQICTVAVNDRLTINQGSILTFTTSVAGFLINGSMKVLGAPGDSVYFKGATENTLGAYEGLYFKDANPDTTSIIQYAVFTDAYYAVRCFNSSPKVHHSRFYKNRRSLYFQTTSNPEVKWNYIALNYEYGIYVTTGSSPMIEYNELFNNNTQNTSAKNQITVGTQNDNSPTIRYNKIHGGSYARTGGISIAALLAGSSSHSEIAYNEIYNNSFGIGMTGGDITCHIHDNLIYNNNINTDPLVSGSGINVNGNSQNRPRASRNIIYGNYWGVTIQNGTTIQAGPEPSFGNLTNADTTDDGQNKIYGNYQDTVVYDFFLNCTNDIYAQNNDWGVYDSLSIEKHITHKADTTVRGYVFFTPFMVPVPVELTAFSATTNNNSVVLNWTTATELNNMGFHVERLAENETNWKDVGYVSGNGTTTQKHDYSFVDLPGNAGKFSYRLRQVDFDGTSDLSNTIFVDLSGVILSHQLNQNYPNPFNPETVINYTVGGNETQRVALRIYDALGAEVTTLVEDFQTPGNYSVKFNTQSAGLNLSSGVYLYELTINSTTITKKLIVNK